MITPKTDWNGGADEFFNVSDYERITANLNEAARTAGIAEFVFYPAGYLTYQMNYAFSGIAGQYNKLIDAMGYAAVYPKIPVEGRTTWFLWRELNNIEGLCADIDGRMEQIIKCGLPQAICGGATTGGGLL